VATAPPTAIPNPTYTAIVPTVTPYPTVTPLATNIPNMSVSDLVKEIRPSVVRINTNTGTGSGVIINTNFDGSAHLLTNYHVIEGTSSISIVVNDLEQYTGILLGTDALRDLAVIRICCSEDFQERPLADASTVLTGDEVVAIGYALGYEGVATVTTGIVSALRYEKKWDRWVIQTDAPINPGNSGGPLLSRKGEVIGINTYLLREENSLSAIQGFGFAVSTATIIPLLSDLGSETATTSGSPKPTPTATAQGCQTNLSDNYRGTIVNLTYGTTASISADISQVNCTISGYLNVYYPLSGSGPISTGTVNGSQLSFIVRFNYLNLHYIGRVELDGRLVGNYTVTSTGEYGVWCLSPLAAAECSVPESITPTPTLTPTPQVPPKDYTQVKSIGTRLKFRLDG
jgi:S1-C subfamily serine protease